MKTESGSTKIPSLMSSPATLAESQGEEAWWRASGESPSRLIKAAMPQAKERPIATVPIIPATLRGSARKPSAITIEPSSGNSRTSQHQAVAVMNNSASQAPRSSAAQLPQIVDVERQTAAENGDDQAKADDDLTGGDHHHDHREDLTLLVADHAAEGDEGEVAGVQHQLEAEQDHHRRSPDQDSQDAGGEEQGRQDDVPGDVHGDTVPA